MITIYKLLLGSHQISPSDDIARRGHENPLPPEAQIDAPSHLRSLLLFYFNYHLIENGGRRKRRSRHKLNTHQSPIPFILFLALLSVRKYSNELSN